TAVGMLITRAGDRGSHNSSGSSKDPSSTGTKNGRPRETPRPTPHASDADPLLTEARAFREPLGPIAPPSKDAAICARASELARELEKLETSKDVSMEMTNQIVAERGLLLLIAEDLGAADDALNQARHLDHRRADVSAAFGIVQILARHADEAIAPLNTAIA